MIRITEADKYLFVIDTDQNAATFFQELTAYCTGFTKDKEHLDPTVEELAQRFCRDTDPHTEGPDREEWCWFKGLIEKRSDPDLPAWNKHPSTPYPTPKLAANREGRVIKGDRNAEYSNRVYNSVAIFFADRPPDELLTVIMTRAKEYAQNPVTRTNRVKKFKVTGFRLLVERTQLLTSKTWEAAS